MTASDPAHRALTSIADAATAIKELVSERDQAQAALAAERHKSEQLAADNASLRAQIARIANQWAQFKQRFAILDAVMPKAPAAAVSTEKPTERRPLMLSAIVEDIADMTAGRGETGLARNKLFEAAAE
jgi:septal ring factor EnvC (AmiA/AmiB activator)